MIEGEKISVKVSGNDTAVQQEVRDIPAATWEGLDAIDGVKWNYAINGITTSNNTTKGGVGEDATMFQKFAEYDRLGGLIRKNGYPLKMGCFYDFKNKKAHVETKLVIIYKVNSKFIEVPDGQELPIEVRAAMIAEGHEDKGAVTPRKAKKSEKGKVTEDEE